MTEDRPAEYGSYPSLRGRVVVVTGGASGIGEKIVEQFAHQGARVAFLDIQNDAGMQLAKKVGAAGGEAGDAFWPDDAQYRGEPGGMTEDLHDAREGGG